jgi:hypothetical protein
VFFQPEAADHHAVWDIFPASAASGITPGNEVQGEPVFEKNLEKDDFGVFNVGHIHIKYREAVEEEVEDTQVFERLCIQC